MTSTPTDTLDPGRHYVIRVVGQTPTGKRWAASVVSGYLLVEALAVFPILERTVARLCGKLASEGADPRTMEWTGEPWSHGGVPR